MSGGCIFDRPGYPPVDGPPPPGTVLRSLKVTCLAQAATVLFLTLSLLGIAPDIAAWVVISLVVLLVVRGFNVGTVRVEVDGLVLTGLLRTRSLRRDQVESVDYWLVRWRTPTGRLRRWQLWPYENSGLVGDREDGVCWLEDPYVAMRRSQDLRMASGHPVSRCWTAHQV